MPNLERIRDSKVSNRTSEIVRMASGKLAGYTICGPLYAQPATMLIAPIPVALRNLQELALKTMDPNAQVYGSQARRASPRTAHWLWIMQACGVMASINACTPRGRLRWITTVLRYARTQKSTDGIEPILATALNAVWARVPPDTALYLFEMTNREMRRSNFAKSRSIPVLDPETFTITTYRPGEVYEVDSKNALLDNFVNQVPHIVGPPPGDPGGRGGFDPTGRGGFDPGGRGGFDPTGRGGFDPTGSGGFDPTGRGGFTPTGSGGFNPTGRGGLGVGEGSEGVGLPGIGVGGPYNGLQGSNYTPQGLGDEAGFDLEKTIGRGLQGLAGVAAFGAAASLATGVGLPLAFVFAGEAAVAGFVGQVLVDDADERMAKEKDKPAKENEVPVPIVAPEPTTTPDPAPTPAPAPTPNPDGYPQPDSVGRLDYYPNPEGTGAGGPASTGISMVNVIAQTGPGLLARLVQIGPQTIAIR
jgi:hypothetical protein